MSLEAALALLQDTTLRAELRRAWKESNPGPSGGHEEGGFICRAQDGTLNVDRWPKGTGEEILVPSHPGCRRNGEEIVASFHTHPNLGSGYQPEPSDMDIETIKSDANLKGSSFIGEYVLSHADVFLVSPMGIVTFLGTLNDLISG